MFTPVPHLRKGDTIGLFSPSSPMAALVPHRTERAVAQLQALGFRVKIAPHAKGRTGWTAGTPEDRARDLQSLFEDEEVHAIMAFIGGNHSNQMLEYLDFDTIKKHPKIFVGYSDVTVLHAALYTKCGFSTFYGPAAITQFAENPSILPYTWEYFERAVMRTESIGIVKASEQWTEETLNWFTKADLERPKTMLPNDGMRWLKKGTASGPLVGGCITSLSHLRGTDYWPNFDGALFFWETPESSADVSKGKSIAEIDAHLTDMDLAGIFKRISGMLVGRPFGYTQQEKEDFQRIILERTVRYDFPILADIDIGHTNPMITIPIGVLGKIDSSSDSFEILESGVR